MKNTFFPLLLFLIFLFFASCEPDNPREIEPEPEEEIIHIPDEHFKAALVSTNSIDTNGDGVGDINIDVNADGEIQRTEGKLIRGLILHFDYLEIERLVDLRGIENFINLEFVKITGANSYAVGETPESALLTYDFTALEKLEYLEVDNLITNHMETLDLSGLTNLVALKLINDRPYYDGFDGNNIHLPVNYMDVNLEGVESLTDLDMNNSFLNIDFCEVPSLKKLNMFYLEGGEPEVFDFHCLTNLEWLNIGENRIQSLILKNSSVVNTLLSTDIGSAPGANYPFVEYICIDDIPQEYEQIATLRDENTVVVTDCE